MNVDRSDPFVFGGVVVDGDGAMEGRELEDPAAGPTEFMRQVEPPPGQVEETVVFLGTMFEQEGEDPRRGSDR